MPLEIARRFKMITDLEIKALVQQCQLWEIFQKGLSADLIKSLYNSYSSQFHLPQNFNRTCMSHKIKVIFPKNYLIKSIVKPTRLPDSSLAS